MSSVLFNSEDLDCSDFFASIALALSLFFSISVAIFSLIVSFSFCSKRFSFSLILFSFSFNQSSNLFSASSSVNAPFLAPIIKCFFINTPLYDKIALAVFVG